MNDEQKSIEALNRFKNGDESAFSYLYEAYFEYAYQTVKMNWSAATKEDCEDMVQEAMIKCANAIRNGYDVTNFGGLVKTTTKNVVLDHHKYMNAKKRPTEVASTFQIGDDDDETGELYDTNRSEVQEAMLHANEYYQSPEESFEQKEVAAIVQSVINELPDYQLDAVTQVCLNGLKYREVAEIYGVSVDTIKSRVNQGKKKIEKRILELEKEQKIKLHSIAPLGFFFLLFTKDITSEAAEVKATIDFSATASIVTNSATASTAAVSSVTSGTVSSSTVAGISKTITIAGKTISTKVAAIVAAAVVGTGATVGVAMNKDNNRASWEIMFDYLEDKEYAAAANYYVETAVKSCIDHYRGNIPEGAICVPYFEPEDYYDEAGKFIWPPDANPEEPAIYYIEAYYEEHRVNDLMTHNLGLEYGYEYTIIDTENVDSWTIFIAKKTDTPYVNPYIEETEDLETDTAIDDVAEEVVPLEDPTESEYVVEEEVVTEEPVSDTSIQVDFPEGRYDSESGDYLSIPMYSSREPGEIFIGLVSSNLFADSMYIPESDSNIYELSSSWKEFIETGYKIVIYSDGSLKLFLNDEYIDTFTITEYYYH